MSHETLAYPLQCIYKHLRPLSKSVIPKGHQVDKSNRMTRIITSVYIHVRTCTCTYM